MENQNGTGGCSYKNGALPSCAPLALGYVPMQPCSEPAYDAGDALKRGTLFPGLDLPFMNMVNMEDVDDTPLGEVMALCFVVHELHLYLDTHPGDTQAFQTMQAVQRLAQEAKQRYTAKYGPLCVEDLMESKRFSWLDDPWPWLYQR